jgi:ParB family chromosome partitioning protein
MRLLKLDPIIQTGIRDGFVSMGHGRALVNVDNIQTQLDLYKLIVKKGLSVRATEILVRNTKEPKTYKGFSYRPPFVKQAAHDLEILFETPVSVSANVEGKGVLKISFDSQKKLQYILNKVKGEI